MLRVPVFLRFVVPLVRPMFDTAIMSGPDQISDVWQGLDRLAFCENAILLELKNKSQGPIITPSKAKRQHHKPGSDGHPYSDAFLDDIALIASADGGRDNVAAACLERDMNEPSGLVVRIAQNEGLERICVETCRKS